MCVSAIVSLFTSTIIYQHSLLITHDFTIEKKMSSTKQKLLPKSGVSNVKIILLQSVVGGNGDGSSKMSLNTLLEAAKFLEMQEQEERQHRTAGDPHHLAMTTIRAVTTVNGGSTHVPNRTGTTTPQTFSLQPVKILNSPALGNGSHHPPPTQTVVISSNNISSTFLQGIHAAAVSPPSTTSPENGSPVPNLPQIKKEQDGHISSTTMSQSQKRIMHNSFDIMNPLVIDETGPSEPKKLKQPPMVFRSVYDILGTREVHNKLEKCRRAHLKECFDLLKKQLPANGDEKKTSNLSILHSALKYIQTLKRRESEYEHQLERLAREKIAYQQRLATLKKDSPFGNLDFSKIVSEVPSSTTSLSQRMKQRDSGEGSMGTSPSPSSTSMSPTIVSPSYTISECSPIKVEHATAEDTYAEYSEDISVSLGNSLNVVTVASPGLVTVAGSTSDLVSSASEVPVISQTNSVITAMNGDGKIAIASKGVVTVAPSSTATKELTQPVQTTGISVLPMTYPVNQGLVLQKVAIVPHKGLTELAPLVSTHFITTPQQLNGINGQINGKVVPLTQYIVKPMVVVSTASPRPGS
ncbi:max-binding protein MNT isoform X2 [Euwallacea similis]|uniref:max-binding protein MNT isoform X2 n=1 Tax=Euwallacea similis TaxID=1736056 RepID=UPI00344FB12F